ncbi:MAG: hypothetical protein ACTSSA_09540 [Candidatus Freyarchaeota archaeon]
MAKWQEWSDWLREGYYVSYVAEGVRYYEHVIARDLAHYVYEWYETIPAGQTSGPRVPDDLVMTQGYVETSNTNRIWQMIFGIKGQCYIYVELPTDIHRHGVPKVPKPSADMRLVSHFEEWMSDFHEPTFVTEHIMIKPWTDRINLSAYNPKDIDQKPWLNIFINKCITERIGTEENGELLIDGYSIHESLPAKVSAKTKTRFNRWRDTLEKLWKRQIPHRPLTLMPVTAPASE